MDSGRLSPTTMGAVDSVLLTPTTPAECARLEVALNAIESGGKFARSSLGSKPLAVINTVQRQIASHQRDLTPEGRAAFKNDLLSYVRDNITRTPEEIEANNTEEVADAKTALPRSETRKQQAEERRELKEAGNTRTAGALPSPASLRKLKDGLANLPVHLLLGDWLKAEVRGAHADELRIYGRAFFDKSPSADLVIYAYKDGFTLEGFGRDLDLYQEHLAPLGRQRFEPVSKKVLVDRRADHALTSWVGGHLRRASEDDLEAYGIAFFAAKPSG